MEKILPFLWLNGEGEAEVRRAVRAVKDMGIDAFVVESRVHEDFCGESWFAEMDVVLSTAAECGMSVWLLDDKSYPTGVANGALKASYPENNAWHIKAERTDVFGGVKNAKLILRASLEAGDVILGAFMAKRTTATDSFSDFVDVSDGVLGNVLYLDIPDGEYSVFTLVKTLSSAERPYYVDMLNEESVGCLIDAVYQRHFERYENYFGNTFAGFFSDEPRFANGRYGHTDIGNAYECTLGKQGIAYPWSDEVCARLGRPMSDVLALWLDIGESTSDVRVEYMDIITLTYARNFASQLARWCHERGVLYTGHIIEDMGAHARLGCSTGHYFRSMKGADLASVDVVLHQIKPFERKKRHYAPISGGYADPLFFDYTLAKLASSSARTDPDKEGRACCEIFGAYGWGESTQEMLYLANHMLVRGINHFIPHAFYHGMGFKDCPPHFHAGDSLPTDATQKKLFSYMNKACELFSGGTAEITTAVLYNAEAEWTGREHTCVDLVNRYLTESQIDFVMVDFDALASARISEDSFNIGGCDYTALAVPSYSYLPSRYTGLLEKFSRFITVFDGSEQADETTDGLRVYRYTKNGESYEMVVNESSRTLSYSNPRGFAYALNYLDGICTAVNPTVTLRRGEAVVLRNTQDGLICTDGICDARCQERFDVSIKELLSNEFLAYKNGVNVDLDINARDELPEFAGWVKYSFEADTSEYDGLRVEYSGDGCEVRIGEQSFAGVGGMLVCPYKGKGKENIEIVLRTSLAYKYRDSFSTYSYVEPCMVRKVTYLIKK